MSLISYLQITRDCNNNCICCSNPKNNNKFTLQQIFKHIDYIKEKWYTDIILTWWEPTIHKNFFEIIDYINMWWLKSRVITNWIMLANLEFAKKLKDKISVVHLSVYTHKKDLNEWMRKTQWTYKCLVWALLNLYKLWINTQTTTMICKYNQDHLKQIIQFINHINPNITHFVFNIMDPLMMKQSKESIWAIPDLNEIEIYLKELFEYLINKWHTFRIERIPLCKISWYEWVNTECRKLIKNQDRTVVFLDQRGVLNQPTEFFRYWYFDECKICKLFDICSWIYESNTYYKNTKVQPIIQNGVLEKIIKKVNESW